MRIHCPLHGLATLILLSTIIMPSAAIPVSSSNSTTTPTLSKRFPPFSLHGLYLDRAAHLTVLVPTQVSAALLADFYFEVHVRCITSWMQHLPPPQADLMLRWGAFQLVFAATDGSSQGISWEFIRDWSALMCSASMRGYAGIFDQGWWNTAGTLGLYVGLRVVDGAVGVAGGGGGGGLVVVSPQ